ncbi:uncharacterized protein LOC127708924 [Mytilus californianus]|uniref:uncharacterized protein LOC127708924 n=1 Tax=Mytilus californianus TaxID=6549 RepID=UPI0022469606|nr:uncharacterized protein LOC127708924 [Mytilus californianus]
MDTGIDRTVSHRTHYARLGHAAHNLLPMFLQQVLLKFENPEQVCINCSKNKSLSCLLKTREWTRLSNAVQNGYAGFDIPLIYSILRHLHAPTTRPTRGWDNPSGPLENEIEIGDDLERCRRLRHEIINRGNTCVSDQEFNNYYNELKSIACRFERVCQKNENEFVFELERLRTCCMDQAMENEYLKNLEDLHRREKEKKERISQLEDQLKGLQMQDVLETPKRSSMQIGHDKRSFQLSTTSSNENKCTSKLKQEKTDYPIDDFHSETMPTINRSDDCYKTNYARLGHAVHHLLPTFLQEVLLHFEKTHTIYRNCNRNKSLSHRLKPGEWARLRKVEQNGYDDFDIPLIYTILRNLHETAARPTKGWEHPNEPLINEIEIGDDIERCRRNRDEIIHRGNTKVTDRELNQYFDVFKTIAERFEKVCNKRNNEFVSTVEHLQACCMDEATEQKYFEELQDLHQRDKENEERISQLEDQLIGKDIQLPWLVNAGDFQSMLSNGEYLTYENRLSLGGPCQAGKSTLASLLIGNEIPLNWNSTDGVVIYFGRNGIDIKKKKMVPLREGQRGHEVFAKIIRGKPGVCKGSQMEARQQTKSSPGSSSQAVETDVITSQSTNTDMQEGQMATTNSTDHTVFQHFLSQTESVLKDKSIHMSHKCISLATNEIQTLECERLQIQSDILKEVRNGQYRIEIAPSDLIDFGGQKSYDMTHQLFIQHSGTFLLMFDGRFGLHTQLGEYPEGVVAASVLKHWVDSILTYTEDTEDCMPMIMFAATHRDLCKDDTVKMKENFTRDVSQMFSTHENRNHIFLDTVYFITGIDEGDTEIQSMKEQVVIFAMKQSSWGQRRPMQWVPLELQLSNMRMKNINIVTREDLRNVNMLNDDLALNESQLEDFLLVQHSLGKLMYYNLPGLDKHIIIHPPALVNILRSFVTDERFFPADQCLTSILQTMTMTGKIYKKGLLKLWQQETVHRYMPGDTIKEFVIQLLIHLDILIIPKDAKLNSSNPHVYIVPCTIKAIRPSNFNLVGSLEERTICLRYTLARHSIPTALAYKIIGTAINAWPLKYEFQKPCLYHKASVLNVSEDNELRIWIEDNRVMVYMVNQNSLLSISPDIAASVQECLTRNIESSLLFHCQSFGRKITPTKVVDIYTMEVGIPCGSDICFIPSEDALKIDSWKCGKGRKHDTRYLRYWVFDKTQKMCVHGCEGLTNNELEIEPSDKHLVRLGGQIGIKLFEEFFINLGMNKKEWESTEYTYASHNSDGIMSMALKQWRKTKLSKLEKPTLNDLTDALNAVNLDSHLICQVFRENTTLFEIADFNLQAIPTDQHLKELSNQIGNCPLQLGIELGLSFTEVEQSLFSFPKDLPGLVEDIVIKWKRKSKVKTIHSLMLALERVNAGGIRYLLDLSKNLSDANIT